MDFIINGLLKNLEELENFLETEIDFDKDKITDVNIDCQRKIVNDLNFDDIANQLVYHFISELYKNSNDFTDESANFVRACLEEDWDPTKSLDNVNFGEILKRDAILKVDSFENKFKTFIEKKMREKLDSDRNDIIKESDSILVEIENLRNKIANSEENLRLRTAFEKELKENIIKIENEKNEDETEYERLKNVLEKIRNDTNEDLIRIEKETESVLQQIEEINKDNSYLNFLNSLESTIENGREITNIPNNVSEKIINEIKNYNNYLQILKRLENRSTSLKIFDEQFRTSANLRRKILCELKFVLRVEEILEKYEYLGRNALTSSKIMIDPGVEEKIVWSSSSPIPKTFLDNSINVSFLERNFNDRGALEEAISRLLNVEGCIFLDSNVNTHNILFLFLLRNSKFSSYQWWNENLT